MNILLYTTCIYKWYAWFLKWIVITLKKVSALDYPIYEQPKILSLKWSKLLYVSVATTLFPKFGKFRLKVNIEWVFLTNCWLNSTTVYWKCLDNSVSVHMENLSFKEIQYSIWCHRLHTLWSSFWGFPEKSRVSLACQWLYVATSFPPHFR